MPRRKKTDLSRRSRNAMRTRKSAKKTNEEEREISRKVSRDHMARFRASQTQEQKEAARETARLAMRNRRANLKRRARRKYSYIDLNQEAFRYVCNTDDSFHVSVCTNANDSMQAVSWPMPIDVVCGNCGAFKNSEQLPGLCCLNLKVEIKIEDEDIF